MPNTPTNLFLEETMIAFRTLLKDYKIELSEKFTNQDDREFIENFIRSALLSQRASILAEMEGVMKKEEENFFCDNHEMCEGCCGGHCCQSGFTLLKEALSTLK